MGSTLSNPLSWILIIFAVVGIIQALRYVIHVVRKGKVVYHAIKFTRLASVEERLTYQEALGRKSLISLTRRSRIVSRIPIIGRYLARRMYGAPISLVETSLKVVGEARLLINYKAQKEAPSEPPASMPTFSPEIAIH